MTGFRVPSAPRGFHVRRRAKPGRYRLLQIFPGLDRLAAFRLLPARAGELRRLARVAEVEVVDAPFWMYVAPHELPETMRRRGFRPVVSATDCLVIGAPHLRDSPRLVLCMDAVHELCHVLQRRAGRELWDERYSYVDRSTEIEAYRVAIRIARSVGADDAFLRDYLKVEWISRVELSRLWEHMGVAPAAPGRRARSVERTRSGPRERRARGAREDRSVASRRRPRESGSRA